MLAIVRVMRRGEAFLFETEEATYAAVLQNLQRFTMAGDFKVNDFTDDCRFFRTFNFDDFEELEGAIRFDDDFFLPTNSADDVDDLDLVELSPKNTKYFGSRKGFRSMESIWMIRRLFQR